MQWIYYCNSRMTNSIVTLGVVENLLANQESLPKRKWMKVHPRRKRKCSSTKIRDMAMCYKDWKKKKEKSQGKYARRNKLPNTSSKKKRHK